MSIFELNTPTLHRLAYLTEKHSVYCRTLENTLENKKQCLVKHIINLNKINVNLKITK